MSPDIVNIGAAIIFAIAVLHTFSVKYIDRIADRQPVHGGLLRMLAEVEVVFGFWALVLALFLVSMHGLDATIEYLESRNFTEPMFVFAIMVVAASRPILDLAHKMVHGLAVILPLPAATANFVVIMSFVPLLGSFITEPAAMTLAALLLRDHFYAAGLSRSLRYAIVGVLFVNVSIGGTLTPFAAPPILMVAATWDWNLPFMLLHFGWRSALAVLVNAIGITWWYRKELGGIDFRSTRQQQPVPLPMTLVHLVFLTGIVVFAHHAVVFMGLFLFFMGVATGYHRYQDRLILREGLLVAFFLAGLVVLGGQQQWWLQDVLQGMSSTAVYYGAAGLTAITDNAALTYLGSLVDGLSEEFKYSLVAGAVTGGGLTVIANAPNPAGYSILKAHFPGESISALGILKAALLPTLVAILAFRLF